MITKYINKYPKLVLSAIYILYFAFLNTAVNFTFSLAIVGLWSIYIGINLKKHSPFYSVFELMVVSLPVSFVPAFPGILNNASINWFLLFTCCYIALYIHQSIKSRKHLLEMVLSFEFVILGTVGIITILQYIFNYSISYARIGQIALFIISIKATLYFQEQGKFDDDNKKNLEILYRFTTEFAAVFVISQFIFSRFGVNLGLIRFFLPNRVALGFICFDFSILSIYLLSNFFYYIFQIFNNIDTNKIYQSKANFHLAIKALVILVASVMTTARTGIISISIVLTLLIVFYIFVKNSFNWSTRSRIRIGVLLTSILLILVVYVLQSRGLGSSGREFINRESFKYFLRSPLIGNGSAWLSSWKIVPHNLVLQYLVQFGFIFTILLCVYLIHRIMIVLENNLSFFYSLIFIFISSMFVPDILHTRFVTVVFMIAILKSSGEKNQVVAHILSSGGYSGAEKIAISIIENSGSDNSSIYISPDGIIKEILETSKIVGVQVENLNIFKIIELIRVYNITTLYAHDFKASVLISLIPFTGKKISHIHQNPTWLSKFSLNTLLYLFSSIINDKIVYVSEKTLFEFRYYSLIMRKSVVLPNFIDSNCILKKADETELTDLKIYDLAFVGRFEEVKNPIKYLEIVQQVVKSNNNLKCMMIGAGSLSDEIEKFIINHNLTDNVDVYPFSKNPYPYMKNSKILIIPSVWEGFGLVAVEAQVLSTAVICSSVGGLLEIINGENGFFAETIDDYVDYIGKLLNNDSDLSLAVSNGLESSKRYTNISKWRGQISDVLNKDF